MARFQPKRVALSDRNTHYDQNYDWDIISTQPASAADLLYHCGVAIGVNYSETATSGIS